MKLYVYDDNMITGGSHAVPVREYADLAFGDPEEHAAFLTSVRAFAPSLEGVKLARPATSLDELDGPVLAYEDEDELLWPLHDALTATVTGRGAMRKSVRDSLLAHVRVTNIVLGALRRGAPARRTLGNAAAPEFELRETVEVERGADGGTERVRFIEDVRSFARTYAPSLTVTGTDASVVPGSISVAKFTLASSADTPTFALVDDAATSWPDGAVARSGYLLDGSAYASFSALNAALQKRSANEVTIGVAYGVPAGKAGAFVALRVTAIVTDRSGERAAPVTGTAIDTIAPQPRLRVMPQAGEAGTPGDTATATFVFVNDSMQPATFDVTSATVTGPHGVAASPTGFTLGGVPVAPHGTPLQDLRDALAGTTVAPGASVMVGVLYTAPPGRTGDAVDVAVVPAITAGGITVPGPVATVNATVGAPAELALQPIAKAMLAAYRGNLPEPQVRALLDKGRTAVAAVVNTTSPIAVDDPLMAVAAGLAELMELLTDRMIAATETAHARDDVEFVAVR